MNELTLDDAEGMLDLCPDLGDDPVDLLVYGLIRATKLGQFSVTINTLFKQTEPPQFLKIK